MKKKIALLTVVIMLLSCALTGCGADSTAEKYYKAMFNGDIKTADKCMLVSSEDLIAYLEDEEDIDEDELWETLSDTLNEDIDSIDDYYEYAAEKTKDSIEDEYGDNAKIKVKTVYSDDLTDDELDDLIDELEEDYEDVIDTDKIKAAKTVTLQVTIDGKDKKETNEHDLTLVKYGSKWLVEGSMFDSLL